MQSAKEGDDDGRKAVAGGELRHELANGAGGVEQPREAGAAAGEEEAEPDQPAFREAAEARRARRLAQHLDLEADQVPLEQHPGDGRHEQRHHEAHVRPRAGDEERHRGLEQPAFREVQAVWVAQWAVHQRAQHQHRHVGQHQADQDLVRIEPGAQEGRDGGPGGAAGDAGQRHQRQQPPAGGGVERQRDAAARQRADRELALGADVPESAAEAGRQADGDQDQRGGLHGQLGEAAQGGERGDEDQRQRLQRRLPEGGEQDGAGRQRQQDGDERRGIEHGARGLQAGLEAQ
jgi:hypothetical protein